MVDCLSDVEMARYDRLAFPHLKRDWLLSRGGLRNLLSGATKLSPSEITFSENLYGKPQLAGTGPHFNVSHSGDYIVYAFSHHCELGVDIEAITPEFATLRLAARCFSDKEYQSLEGLTPERFTQAFFKIWSGKEAYIKAIGMGLSADLKAFTVLHDQAHQSFKNPELQLESFNLADHYTSAICYRANKPLSINFIELTDFDSPLVMSQ